MLLRQGSEFNKIWSQPVVSPKVLQALPKVELHLHFEGSMSPELIDRLVQEYQLDLKLTFSADKKRILWKDFQDFLNKYDELSKVACSKKAIEEMAYDYLKNAHQQGCIYVELTVSPDHLARFGVNYADAIGAVEAGIKKAKEEFGIESNIIIVILRHGDQPDFADLPASRLRSQAQATKLIDTVLAHQFEHVVGIGLAGAEIQFHPELFKEHFKRAREAGLQVTAHAGEWTDAANVKYVVEELGVPRVGHGLQAVFDKDVLNYCKEKGVHFELCLHSNAELNTAQHYPAESRGGKQPIQILHDNGVSFSLSTDDPPYFDATMVKEYLQAQKKLKLSAAGLLQITYEGIKHSFASAAVKQLLFKKLQDFAEQHQINFTLPQTKTNVL